MEYIYEAEKWNDGDIMDLYRNGPEGYQQYVIGEGWKNTGEAAGAFHGDVFTYRVSKEAADAYVKGCEEYVKKYGNK